MFLQNVIEAITKCRATSMDFVQYSVRISDSLDYQTRIGFLLTGSSLLN
jgi:hypothetical protein